MTKITTLLFDLNGVLILDKPGYMSSDLEKTVYKRLGTSLDDVEELSKILRDLSWDEKKFWDFDERSWQGAVPNTELIDLIKKFKQKGFKIGLVTNTSGISLRRSENAFFGSKISEIFDSVIISSEVHMLKPNKEIYELALHNLEANAEETLFIDDSKRYLEGASLLGINTVLYTDNPKLMEELAAFGVF